MTQIADPALAEKVPEASHALRPFLATCKDSSRGHTLLGLPRTGDCYALALLCHLRSPSERAPVGPPILGIDWTRIYRWGWLSTCL